MTRVPVSVDVCMRLRLSCTVKGHPNLTHERNDRASSSTRKSAQFGCLRRRMRLDCEPNHAARGCEPGVTRRARNGTMHNILYNMPLSRYANACTRYSCQHGLCVCVRLQYWYSKRYSFRPLLFGGMRFIHMRLWRFQKDQRVSR